MTSRPVGVAGWPPLLGPGDRWVGEDLRGDDLRRMFQRRYLECWDPRRERLPDSSPLFCRPRLHVEVGCGRALLLQRLALADSGTLYLGVDRAAAPLRAADRRLGGGWPDNLLLWHRDVVPLVAFLLPDESVDRYEFRCPDPWPARRHRRRRWYWQPAMLEFLRTLRTGGELLFTSDRLPYIQEAAWLLTGRLGCALVSSGPLPLGGGDTHFEIKYLAQGRAVHRLVVRKTGPPEPPRPEGGAP